MKKRIVCLLITLVMIVGLLPAVSLPAAAAEYRDNWSSTPVQGKYGYVKLYNTYVNGENDTCISNDGGRYYPLNNSDDFDYVFRKNSEKNGSYANYWYGITLTADYTADSFKAKVIGLDITLNGHTLTVNGDVDVTVKSDTPSTTDKLYINGGGGTVSFPYNSNSYAFSVNCSGFGDAGVSVLNTTFLNCKGSVFYFNSTSILITRFFDVSFRNCSAAKGSCIYFNTDYIITEFYRCSFLDCSASDKGGAVYVQNLYSDSRIDFVDSYAVNCSAENYGGFMYVDDVDAEIFGGYSYTRDDITRCDKATTVISGCRAKTEDGGAIYMNRGKTLDHFIFADNSAYDYGGAVCVTAGGSTVSNCRFYRNTTQNSRGGGLYVSIGSGKVENCKFFENDAHDSGYDLYSSSGSTAIKNCAFTSKYIPTAALHGGAQSGCSFLDSDGYSLDGIKGNGSEGNPYIIKNTDDWDALYYTVRSYYPNSYENKYFVLADNITVCNSIGAMSNGASPKKPFKGFFDGQGHTVIFCCFNDGSDKALFGVAEGATVKNLTVNGYNKGAYSIGAIFGNAVNCTAENCVNNADIYGTASYTAGIAGWSDHTKFINCANNGSVTCLGTTSFAAPTQESAQAGGIAGCAVSGRFERCTNYGDISAYAGMAGGIAGRAGGKFNLCSNYGDVVGVINLLGTSNIQAIQRFGGLVGSLWESTLLNCLNCGNVVANQYVGGFFGYEEGQASLKNGYMFGKALATSDATGITGHQFDTSYYEFCFYNKDDNAATDKTIGISRDTMFGRSSETVGGKEFKMPDSVNDYIRENGHGKEGWCSISFDSAGRPLLSAFYVGIGGKQVNPALIPHTVTADTAVLGEAGEDTVYLLTGSTTAAGRVEILGNVTLVLPDDVTYTLPSGIKLEKGNSLTIAAQSVGDHAGSLIATGQNRDAAIGGDTCDITRYEEVIYMGDVGAIAELRAYATIHHGGDLTILGGNILARASENGVGIGGGTGTYTQNHTTYTMMPVYSDFFGGTGCNVTMYNGSLTVEARNGVGIGGGRGLYLETELSKQGKTDVTVGDGGKGGSFTYYGGSFSVSSSLSAFGRGKKGDGAISGETEQTVFRNNSAGAGLLYAGSSAQSYTDYGCYTGETDTGIFLNNKYVKLEGHPAHQYAIEYTYSDDFSTCTATQVCTLCPAGYEGHIGDSETVRYDGYADYRGTCGHQLYVYSFTLPGTTTQEKLINPGNHQFELRDINGTMYIRCKNCDLKCPANGYTLYDYIEVRGGAFINTGYRPNQDTRVDMTVRIGSNREYWFGVWDENYNKGTFCLGNDGDGVYSGYGDNGGTDSWGAIANGFHTVTLNENIVRVDGNRRLDYPYAATGFRLANPLYLFAQNRAGTPVTASNNQVILCSRCAIYENSGLERCFVPVADQNGNAGLLDVYEGKFYGNATGRGTITAANISATPVPAKNATCTESGYAAHYLFRGVLYSDEACTNTIPDLAAWSGVTPALGHDFVSNDGAHTRCSRCGAVLTGDVTGDCAINVKDVIRIKKYLAERDSLSGISTVTLDEEAADCTGDGAINVKDVIRLKKYIANRDPQTGESSIHFGPNE